MAGLKVSRVKVKGTKKNYNYECKKCGISIASVLDLDFRCPRCSSPMFSDQKNLLSIFKEFYNGLNKREKELIEFSDNIDRHTIYNVCISVPGQQEGGVLRPNMVDFKKYINLVEKMCSFFKANDYKLHVSQFLEMSARNGMPEFNFVCHFHLDEYDAKEVLVTPINSYGIFDVNKNILKGLDKYPISKKYVFNELKILRGNTINYKEMAEDSLKRYNRELKFYNKLGIDKEETV